MEKKKYTPDELDQLIYEVSAELKKIPGVVGVGFGAKETGGSVSDKIAFRVYVREKKPEDELSPEELIPKEIRGFKTDVLKIDTFQADGCQDRTNPSTKVGGLGISNLKTNSTGSLLVGTLGFFGTFNGNNSRNNYAILTNNHVVSVNGGKEKDPIYQPARKPDLVIDIPKERGLMAVGHVKKIIPRANHAFQYPGENINPVPEYFLDCASIHLNTDISSCCDTNNGIEFSKEIKNLNVNGKNTISGVARIRASDIRDQDNNLIDYPVFKVGATTGKTVGKVIDMRAPSTDITESEQIDSGNMIKIQPVENDCDGILRFSTEGDSGAVVVNSKNEIVGLLVGSRREPPLFAFACHIHPVLDQLQITLLSTPNTSTAGARKSTPADGPENIRYSSREVELEKFAAMRTAFLETEHGKALFSRFGPLRTEVIGLINHCRPVTVAWHRHHGPAFTAHFVKSFHEPGYQVPAEIRSVTRRRLLEAMYAVLSQHGSNTLKQTMDDNAELVLNSAEHWHDLDALLAHILKPKHHAQFSGND